MPGFRRFAWFTLAVNVVVIAWGGFVRATGSGAGCGQHWPMCNGVVVPRSPSAEMLVEYTHRLTSGVALLLVVALLVWARRAFAPGHRARTAAVYAMALMIVEALLGAALVLFGWVAQDTSAARAWVMPIHLTNTFLLLAAIALTAAWSDAAPDRPSGAGRAPLGAAFVAALAGVILTGITGAIAALGDTLFPATSFVQGIAADLDPRSAMLLRLRTLHPVVAVLAGLACIAAARSALVEGASERARAPALALAALVVVQLGVGAVNVALLAPVWLQIVHLILADLTWIALVVTAAERTRRVDARLPGRLRAATA
jgi:cytochrome c oxidase assembly protein subunit 15